MTKSRRLVDLSRLKVHSLAERENLARVEDILVDPAATPPPLSEVNRQLVAEAAERIAEARRRGATVMLIYGAHLLRNGAAHIVERFLADGWITHLATNGAGSIHDWEFAWQGASTESVQMNVANGTFGTWDETATNLHLAILAGALEGLSYGESVGRFIHEDGVALPEPAELQRAIAAAPGDRLTAARADLLRTMTSFGIAGGRLAVEHRWKHASLLASAYAHGVPATVHPGIGYDIIANHPMFSGAAIGRAAEIDFKLFAGSVEGLSDGVVLNVGSAIMGPQVFEKSLSCVNNLRLQSGERAIAGHSIYVVDIQDGGAWNWARGEPPKTHPAYYLRFCKSFSRMGGAMHYVQCDNVQFVHHLLHRLKPC
jgi:hypothetical protein